MSQDLTDDDRRSDLEAAFAAPSDKDGNMASTAAIGQQIEMVPLGAQNVAVKRDERNILQKIKAVAAALGSDFYYQWEVNKKGGGKELIEGPSIDAALYVVRLYGNCDVDVRVQHFKESWLFYARFTDFETGFRLSRAYEQRKGQNIGMKDADRARDIVFQIGQSKAIRNVICNALRPFTDFAFQEAKHAIVEQVGKDLQKYLGRIASRLKELDVNADRVERVVGRTMDKWNAQDAAKVIANLQSVKDGMIHPDDLWPTRDPNEPRPQPGDFVDDEKPPKDTNESQGPANGDGKPAETTPADPKPTEPARERAPVPSAAKKKAAEKEKPTPASEPKPQEALRAKGDTLSLWLADQYDDLDKATTVDDVEAVREGVEREVAETPEYEAFAAYASARMNAIRGGKRS